MEKIYYNPEHPAAYGGINRLVKASGKPRSKVKEFLYSQDVYTLHAPVRKRFPRSRIFSQGINEIFEADLMDMQMLKKQNKGFGFVLAVIDVFSKYGWLFPIRQKTGKEIVDKLKLLFQERKPKYLRTDKGKEFENRVVQNFLQQNNVKFYTSENEVKCAIVERFIKTMKQKIYRYMTHKGKYRYIDVLPALVKGYNAAYHRSIKMAPKEVSKKNEKLVRKNLYGSLKKISPKFKIGDKIRISKSRGVFKKGYTQGYSDEVFLIKKIIPSSIPPRYILEDMLGNSIKGSFYEPELQLVIKSESDLWMVEKILKTRLRNKKKEYYVKFKGFDKRFNQWIPEENLQTIS